MSDPHRARKNLSETVAKPKSSNGGRIITLPPRYGEAVDDIYKVILVFV